MKSSILSNIKEASKVIGDTWPLYTFVASNPLSGYENKSFEDAVGLAHKHFGANSFPEMYLYKQALENGNIDHDLLDTLLKNNGFSETPEYYLNSMRTHTQSPQINENQTLDRLMTKWLSAFMDEGLAEWEMPYKTEGFYVAWRLLAIYDSDLGSTRLKDIPKTSIAALEQLMEGYGEEEQLKIFTAHLASLPGWTGYINHRTQSHSDWQEEFPIDMIDYLAVRLWSAKKLGISIDKDIEHTDRNDATPRLQHIWLQAWEQSWQNQLTHVLESESIATTTTSETNVPDAQMVFCIDTRSELIRRHVEAAGNYETFGYAGFFGIAMDYKSLNDGISRKACPPIVGSAYEVTEIEQPGKQDEFLSYNRKNKLQRFKDYFLKRMKNMLPSAFGYVEGSGFYYGLSLIGKTLIPAALYKRDQRNAQELEATCEPQIDKASKQDGDTSGIPLDEKVGIVKSAFALMGWTQFAPLVIFAGHGSHSANNPFSSSLDCGACAASPGRHNARMLAKLANLKEVRTALAEIHDINIPDGTLFLGAEHNTTTDDIVIFDADAPDYFKQLIADLKANLSQAQKSAVPNRLNEDGKKISAVHQKANNWSETRPEWGLAKNAGFIVGPRDLTKHTDLDSRCFLHSYNWKLDESGAALEGIMQGPMVVTQWINNHYYFSTVDNDTYGGGSKITHNITGKFGIVQGNGGDLKMGLPLQSLYATDEEMHHQPLRLSVVIQAPVSRVSEILVKNENLRTLLDNEWMYLMVMDPLQNNEIFKYHKSVDWKAVSKKLPHSDVEQASEFATV